MRTRARLVFAASVAALVAALIAGLWALVAQPAGPTLRLTDGTTAQVESITYGTDHSWTHGTRWQKLLFPITPDWLKARTGWWSTQTGWDTGGVFSSEQELVIVSTCRGVTPHKDWDVCAVAVDRQGREWYTGPPVASGSSPMPIGWCEWWCLSVFPRREGSVRIRLYKAHWGANSSRLGEIVVANPCPGPYPTWTPAPLPITKHAGDLDVTLRHLTPGPTRAAAWSSRPPEDATWTRASFEIRRDGRPVPDWNPIGITVSDATGNTWTQQLLDRRLQQVDILGALPLSERAWKLKVELSKTSGFGPEELWRVRSIRIPPRDQINTNAAITTRQGTRLALSVEGADHPIPTINFQRYPVISLSVPRSANDLSIPLLAVSDERGRALVTTNRETPPDDDGKMRYYLDRLPPGTKTLNLLFAVRKNRFVEFLVAPPGG